MRTFAPRTHRGRHQPAAARGPKPPSIATPQSETEPDFGHDPSRVRISDPSGAAEQEAEHAARDVMAGRPAQVRTAAPIGTLYRQPLPDFASRPSPRMARLMGSELLDDFAL